MKRARFSLALTAALLTLNPVQASTFNTLTLTQQAKKAQVIVRATVGSPTTSQTGSGPTAVSWINYPLTVTETIAGDVASLPVREGKPTLMFLAGLQDVPALNSGQDVFLLLYTGTQDSPLVGFNQGAYPVVSGRVTRWNEAATAALEAALPAQTATPTSTATANTATASNATGASATATTPPATLPPATTPLVDGATAAVSNPVTPSPTPTTGTGTPPATAGTTTTPPAGTTTTVNPAPASATATPSLTATPASTAAPAAPVTPAATPSAATPDPFERDPAKFRDQLRAARNSP